MKKFKRIVAIILVFTMLSPLGCAQKSGEDKTAAFDISAYDKQMKISKLSYSYSLGNIKMMSRKALYDLYNNFYLGTPEDGSVRGGITAALLFLTAFYNEYLLYGEEEIKQMFESEMKKLYAMDEAEITVAGSSTLPALDDCAYTALRLITAYKVTGDERLLDYADKIYKSTYERWWDDIYGGGLWYNNHGAAGGDGVFNRWKSLYGAAYSIAGFELYTLVGDQYYLDCAIAEYEWMHKALSEGRSDGIYTCDYMDAGPANGSDLNYITRNGSCSYLGGNVGMAVCHYWMYKHTNDEKYLDRTYKTLGGILKKFILEDTFLMDRDAATNAFYFDYLVTDLIEMKQKGIDKGYFDKYNDYLCNTAIMIYENNRTEKGYYSGAWCYLEAGEISIPEQAGVGSPEFLFTSSNSVQVVTAAARMEHEVIKDIEAENNVDIPEIELESYFFERKTLREYDRLGGGNTKLSHWNVAGWTVKETDSGVALALNSNNVAGASYAKSVNAKKGFYISFDMKWDEANILQTSACWSLNAADGSRILSRVFQNNGTTSIEMSLTNSVKNTWDAQVFKGIGWVPSEFFARIEIYCFAGSGEICVSLKNIYNEEVFSCLLLNTNIEGNTVFESNLTLTLGGDTSFACEFDNIKIETSYSE